MVVSSDGLVVELVEASSKKPFKEHHKDGLVYVEVEPEAEYFIHAKLLCSQTPSALLPDWERQRRTDAVILKFRVDGQPLKYQVPLTTFNVGSYYGSWQYRCGLSTQRALKLSRTALLNVGSVADKNGADSGGDSKVEIDVYECIDDGTSVVSGRAYDMKFAPASPCSGVGVGKKAVRSTQGDISVSRKVSTDRRQYQTGKLLKTISLHYCSTAGLIDVGVLPKPNDLWEFHRICNPSSRMITSADAVAVTPSIHTISETLEDGTKLNREVMIFDLSECDEESSSDSV